MEAPPGQACSLPAGNDTASVLSPGTRGNSDPTTVLSGLAQDVFENTLGGPLVSHSR